MNLCPGRPTVSAVCRTGEKHKMSVDFSLPRPAVTFPSDVCRKPTVSCFPEIGRQFVPFQNVNKFPLANFENQPRAGMKNGIIMEGQGNINHRYG